MKYLFSFTFLFANCFAVNSTLAEFVQLNVQGRRDYSFDHNGILYISTAGGSIVRYNTHTSTYLTPFNIGGSLNGIDLSPDGTTLAVADQSIQGLNNRIELVNTATGISVPVSFARQSGEAGTFMVAWGADDRVMVTTDFIGSGWVPLRTYDPQSGVTTTIGNVRQSSMLTASANRHVIAIAESNNSSGPVSSYDVDNHVFQAGTSANWFTYEVAVDRDGDQFLVPTYGGGFVYELNGGLLQTISVIGQYALHGPIGAVYSPVNDILFTAEWSRIAPEYGVRVYDANSMKLLDTIDPYPFESSGNTAMDEGRMEISPDGHFLAVSVANGVRVYDVSAYVPELAPIPLLAIGTIPLLTHVYRTRRRSSWDQSAR